jgi:acyl carrier protein
MANESSTTARDEKDIRSRIHGFILTEFLRGENPGTLTDTTPLVSGGIIDSLSSLQLGLFLEETFAIKLAPEELVSPSNLETIDAITKLVTSRVG